MVDEPRKGLVVARETGRRAASGDILVYLDADCRAPLTWLARIERHFRARPRAACALGPVPVLRLGLVGQALIRAYDFTLAPATQLLVKYVLRIGTIFYGGNFAVRRDALERDRRIRHLDRVSRRRHQSRPAAVRGRQGGALP